MKSYKMRITLIIGLFLIGPALDATSIVAIWTDKQITIAADSRQTLLGRDGQRLGSQNACKIYPVRNLIFAFSGLAKAEEVDVIESVKTAREFTESGTGKSLPETGLMIAAMQALEKVLNQPAHQGPTNVPRNAATMIIAGNIGGSLLMYRTDITVVSPGQCCGLAFSTTRVAYPEDLGNIKTTGIKKYEFAGLHGAISRFQFALPTEWNQGSDVQTVRRLIAIEASDATDSQFVVPPISIITITKNGAHWVDKGVCAWEPSKLGKK